jgi:hypothetical protein
MKKYILVIGLFFFLSACQATPARVPTATSTPVPPSTFTPIPPTSTPKPAPENIADAKDLSIWINDYVHAFGGKVTVNGVEMDASQLTDEIRRNGVNFTQAKQVNGISFLFLVVNDIPLAVLNNGKWNRTTIKFLDDIVNMRFGSTVHEGALFVNYTGPYKQVLDEQFEIIAPIDPTIVDVSNVMKDPYYGKFIRSFEQTHSIRFGSLFFSADHRENNQPNLKDSLWDGAPNVGAKPSIEYQEKIKIAMMQKALDILTSNPFVTEIGFANEAFAATDDGYFAWEDSPYYRAFGENWLIEAYLATYYAVVKLGNVPGKDIQIFYGDYNFELPGNKSNIVHRELARLKVEVAKALGINPQDVPIVVSMQCHVIFTNNNPENPFYWGQFYAGNITYEKLRSNFASFSDIGRIWLGEVTFLEGTREQYSETLSTILQASIDSGNVESILFWDLLEIDSNYWGQGNLLFEFDGVNEFLPTTTYYEVLKTLFKAK